MGVKERQRLRQQAKHKKEQLDRLREEQNVQSAENEVAAALLTLQLSQQSGVQAQPSGCACRLTDISSGSSFTYGQSAAARRAPACMCGYFLVK